MDLLADVLRQSGLRRRLLSLRALPERTAFAFPCERSIGFHVVTTGTLTIRTADRKSEPMLLKAGDVALMARGQHHLVHAGSKFSRKDMRLIGENDPAFQQNAEGEGAAAAMVSGAYQLWNPPVHQFFRELPEWYVLRAETLETFDELPLTIALLRSEVRGRELGSEQVVNALLDVIFTQILRRIVKQQGERAQSWGRAVGEPRIRAVLEVLHADSQQDWTLEKLARRAGISRAGLAQKFREALGETPLQYLRTVRMQRAMRLLSESDEKLEAVAAAVGYQDAFGFSKAFRRTVGISPREFRLKNDMDQQDQYRFGQREAFGLESEVHKADRRSARNG